MVPRLSGEFGLGAGTRGGALSITNKFLCNFSYSSLKGVVVRILRKWWYEISEPPMRGLADLLLP
jgi:hypothetical protein